MADIIHLLPDSVANQIAAGEVIQRPSSVIKELVENSVDAGADEINVIVKDAGRTLIQVIDNGIGMSDTDARLAFERHATSKIRSAEDLFEIRTKGFRGEALASVAAIAQVILKTRQNDEEIGTEIGINGSAIDYQRSIACPAGTNFTVKNLFYNVPARRKFLKSNSTELKHIINEFQHIVLSHPEVSFSLCHNDSDIYRLPAGNIKQRVSHVFGRAILQNLNPLNADTSLIKLAGFIGKPENVRKTTGEQFFFTNRRYMRHPYFHKAVLRAYEKLIPSDSYPSYFIFFDIDPGSIDVNIHPTKTEIKFENEQAVFQIIQAAVREALGKSSVVPSIDFDTHGVIDIPFLRKNTEINYPNIPVDPTYDPFQTAKGSEKKINAGFARQNPDPEGWEKLYDGTVTSGEREEGLTADLFPEEEAAISPSQFMQFNNRYILTPVKSGLMIIDHKLAYERILYEQFIHSVANNHGIAQRELYPTKIDLDPGDYLLIKEIKDELSMLGIEISDLGSNTIVVNTCPAGLNNPELRDMLEAILEDYKQTEQHVGTSVMMTVAASLAKAASTGVKKILQEAEMRQLVDELFACENPNYSFEGRKIMSIIQKDEIEQYLK